ncbi:MAG: malonyl-CoA decarboxylase, partial [Pseudomonadota bacterium]
ATLCKLMIESDGEYSSLLLADRILNAFENLSDEAQIDFFHLLNEKYDLNHEELKNLVDRYESTPDAPTLKKLIKAAEPTRQVLLRRMNLIPGGTPRLVKMREKLLVASRQYPELKKMDIDFRNLLNSWFNRGFLVLKHIDWTTPAHILEKIIAYEAVHAIGSWRELRARLEPSDRLCFAFFHPAMEDEPLVFVQVALTQDLPSRIDHVLDADREVLEPEAADSAIFYSISNCHDGLGGVSFGNFLIKQVATTLQREFPHLKKFATLSPSPTFAGWVQKEAETDQTAAELLDRVNKSGDALQSLESQTDVAALACRYYLQAKTPRQTPIDPVARFHLRNGARLERINPLADQSTKGIENSLGLMVNYVYDLARVEENHENYIHNHQVVHSPAIKKLASTSLES